MPDEDIRSVPCLGASAGFSESRLFEANMYRVCTAPRAGYLFAPLFFAAVLTAGDTPAIAVFLDFESDPSSAALSEMKHETAEILKPSGLEFDWHLMRDRRAGESFPDLVVVTLRGSCSANAPAASERDLFALGGVPLAFTRISDGRILPFMDVKCDTIRTYLAREMASARPAQRDLLLGRALGRVVAHELYHILAETALHGHEGVARSAMTRSDLISSAFGFSDEETQTLHNQKWKQLTLSTDEAPDPGQGR
jgi:hypothetical protein